MPFVKFPFQTGIYKDDSPLSAEGFFIDADKMRPVRGKYQTIGGWEAASNTTLTGIARGAMTWADNDGNPFAAFGSHLRLYTMDVDGNVDDRTPVIERGTLSSAFSTVDTDNTVTVSDTSHGLSIGQKVKFLDSVTVGGIDMQGEWVVDTVPDANSYTFEHTSAATSTVNTTGSSEYEYFLAPGQADGIGGLGYGTGGAGSGGFGDSSSGYKLYPRTWTLDRWGQNLLASPRGGTIYEQAPSTSASELVTNGDFSASDGWTVGAGWTVFAGFAGASVASSALEQPITPNYADWNIVRLDATVSSGSFVATYNSLTIGAAISSTGTYYRTFYGSGEAQFQLYGSSFTGNVAALSVKALLTAEAVPGAPSQTNAIFVTDSRHVVALGFPDEDYNYDPMRVGWSDTGVNTTWTAGASNLAGSFPLGGFGIGSKLIRGMATYGEHIIFGNNGLVSMRETGDPSTVFDFDLVGTGCGLIGPHAVCEAHGALFWMSPSGQFYQYAGGQINPLDSTLRRHVFDNLAQVQGDKVYAWHNSAWNEVWWCYPVTNNEVSHYTIYSYLTGEWTNGTFDRTSWVDASVFGFPLAVDDDGKVWFHEKGFSEDGGARQWSLETGWTDIGDGDTNMLMLGFNPDHEDLQGGYTVTVTTRTENTRGVTERTLGPFNVTNNTGRVNFRANGQQIKVKWTGNDAPTFYRMGAPSFDVQDSGRRR